MLHGKYRRPIFTGGYIVRQRLIEKLDTFQKLPLTIVKAPAGYGKTTLVNAWAEKSSVPVVWLSLDDNDNDLQIFVSYLVGAFRTSFPEILQKTFTLASALISPPFDTLSKCLVSELDDLGQKTVLVLDNYELVYDRQIHELVAALLKYPLPQLHILLTTRRDPPFNIDGLRARNLLGEITTKDLLFTREEAKALFNEILSGRLDDVPVEDISREMEGWATGLWLYAASLAQTSENGGVPSALADASRHVKDYLSSEVLCRITAFSREFMYRLAVLNELCEGLCDALFQGSAHSAPVIGGQNLLRRLERENLFVSTSGSGPGWYRLHPVFRAVLQAHMEESYNRDEIDRLHITAANWHVHQGRFEDALYHARNMPARDALDIFLRHRLALQQLATWQTMEEWLALFPPDLIESHPDLLLSEAWLMLANLRLPETAKLLDKVEAAFNARNEPDVEKWAELKIIRATYFLRTGDTARVLEYLHAAGKIQPVGYFLKEAAISVRSDAYRLEGDIAAWRELLREHLVFTRSAVDNQISLRLLPSLCTLNMVTARPEDAEKTAYFMLTVARERNNQRYIGIASLYLGAVAYQKNELQRAESYFLDALELAPFMDTDKVITCYLGLAATMRALGHKVKAREALENAKSYLVAIHSLDLLPYIEIFDAEMMLRQGTQIYHKLSLPPEWRLLWTDIIYHPGLTLCRNLLAGNRSENRDKVLSMLEEMDEHAVSTGNEFLRIGVLAQAALTLAASERHGDANEYLVRALDLAEGTGCLRIFIDLGIPMARLLHRSGLPQTGIAAKIRDAFTREPPLETEAARKTMVEHLTDQELRVLDFLRQRFSNKEIADQLSITAATVKSHTIRVYQKLDVHCRREAVEKASRLGIFIA